MQQRNGSIREKGRSWRATLFGDAPLNEWARYGSGEPWSCFTEAVEHTKTRQRDRAAQALFKVVSTPRLPSRHYLEAWFGLRELGFPPHSEVARYVYGVVVEVGLDGGVDTLAVYEDRSVRYVSLNGDIVICELAGRPLDLGIESVLSTARRVMSAGSVQESNTSSYPTRHSARMSFLTPQGVHVIEGPLSAFARDLSAAPVFSAATSVMLSLTGRARLAS